MRIITSHNSQMPGVKTDGDDDDVLSEAESELDNAGNTETGRPGTGGHASLRVKQLTMAETLILRCHTLTGIKLGANK